MPGTVEAGSRTDLITAFWDFAPTAIELAGGHRPEQMDGISIVSTLQGKPDQQAVHDYLYWEFHEQGGKQAVRIGKWKGVRLNVKTVRYGPIELYDLKNDISETTDVADQHSDIVKRMAEVMDEAHESSELFSFE